MTQRLKTKSKHPMIIDPYNPKARDGPDFTLSDHDYEQSETPDIIAKLEKDPRFAKLSKQQKQARIA
jgi:hypothetical protein